MATRSGYEAWAAHRNECPSGDTIEKVLLWHEAVNKALRLMRTLERRDDFVALVEAAKAGRREMLGLDR